MRVGGEPLVASAPKRPSSVGPLMSLRSALGAFQAMNGSRGKAKGDSSRDFIADRIFCWRRARVRSDSALLQSLWRGGGGGGGRVPCAWGVALFWGGGGGAGFEPPLRRRGAAAGP